MTSGAIQYGVPTSDLRFGNSDVTCAQNPKSDNFTYIRQTGNISIQCIISAHLFCEKALVLMLESEHKWSNTLHQQPVVDEKRMRPGHWLRSMPCASFSTLTLEETQSIHKILVPRVLNGLHSHQNSTKNKKCTITVIIRGIVRNLRYTKAESDGALPLCTTGGVYSTPQRSLMDGLRGPLRSCSGEEARRE